MAGKKEGIRILSARCITCEVLQSCVLRRNFDGKNCGDLFVVEMGKRHPDLKKIDCLINFVPLKNSLS